MGDDAADGLPSRVPLLHPTANRRLRRAREGLAHPKNLKKSTQENCIEKERDQLADQAATERAEEEERRRAARERAKLEKRLEKLLADGRMAMERMSLLLMAAQRRSGIGKFGDMSAVDQARLAEASRASINLTRECLDVETQLGPRRTGSFNDGIGRLRSSRRSTWSCSLPRQVREHSAGAALVLERLAELERKLSRVDSRTSVLILLVAALIIIVVFAWL